MDKDKEFVPEDLPTDGEMVGIGASNEYSIHARTLRDRKHLRKIKSMAEDKEAEAVIELLQFAFCLSKKFSDEIEKIKQTSDEIESCQETSLDRLMLASLLKPIEHLLQNENAMRAAFGIAKKREGTGKYRRTIRFHKELANQMYDHILKDPALTIAQAKNKVLEDINDARSPRTLDRAHNDHWLEVRRERIDAAIKNMFEEKHREKKQQ